MAAANVGAISHREWRTAQECILAAGDPAAGAAGGAMMGTQASIETGNETDR